jgi:hypothetical protein
VATMHAVAPDHTQPLLRSVVVVWSAIRVATMHAVAPGHTQPLSTSVAQGQS